MLLIAFSMARRNGLPSDVTLLCTDAPGERVREIKHASKSLDLGDVAVFPGFLSEQEFASVTRSCLRVIFPSLCEGFLKATSAACPVASVATTRHCPQKGNKNIRLFKNGRSNSLDR